MEESVIMIKFLFQIAVQFFQYVHEFFGTKKKDTELVNNSTSIRGEKLLCTTVRREILEMNKKYVVKLIFWLITQRSKKISIPRC